MYKILEKRFHINCTATSKDEICRTIFDRMMHNPRKSDVTDLWAFYKYEVLSHSPKHYQTIRNRLKTPCSLSELKFLIDEALSIEPTRGTECNALEHCWGYFKTLTSANTLDSFQVALQTFKDGQTDAMPLRAMLLNLALEYKVEYLCCSSYLLP